MRPVIRFQSLGLIAVLTLLGCGGTSKRANAPQTHTTAASIAPRIERLVVADKGTMAMIARNGCLASVTTSETAIGSHDELLVRCPKEDRLKTWFDGADRVMSSFVYAPAKEDDEAEGPHAMVRTADGRTLKLVRTGDIERLAKEVIAFSAELGSKEQPTPGPASAAGWQMLHVSGPANVVFAGTPARGRFDAKVSTSGQYLCEFVTNVGGEGPLRATKSGWMPPQAASKGIDHVLAPYTEATPNDRQKAIFAAGMKQGVEQRTNAMTTGAVFERFAVMQETLGDACLPELEAPPAASVKL